MTTAQDKGRCSDQDGSQPIRDERPMSMQQPPRLQRQGLMAVVKSPTRELQAFLYGNSEPMPLCDALTLAIMYQ